MTTKPSSPVVLDRDQLWAAVDAQRLRVVDLLERLSDEQWRHASLCDGWTVRDVAAHLTLQQLGAGEAIAMMVRYRGDTDRAIHTSARRRAAAVLPDQLIEQIRGTVGSRRHNVGLSVRETLIDILVHGLDIAIPLGLPLDVPLDAAAAAVSRMWTTRWPPPFPATRLMTRFRVTASDTAWSAGAGPSVRAPIASIMLLAAGRLIALPELTGEGAPELAAHLSAAAAP